MNKKVLTAVGLLAAVLIAAGVKNQSRNTKKLRFQQWAFCNLCHTQHWMRLIRVSKRA